MQDDAERKKRTDRPHDATRGIPVIGLGGSAGALEAFATFFRAMPADIGAAFVVIQHLAPEHKSLLPQLLAKHTRMTVTQAVDTVPVTPNCVYVIPPNRDLAIDDGVLHLTESVKLKGIRMPIDFFFRSLADDCREKAIGILFSGTGSDGTLGVRAIRGAGGLTLAQDPSTAQYGDMAQSAIATQRVDSVLPPDQLPQAVADYLQHPYVTRDGAPSADLPDPQVVGGLDEILDSVHAQTHCDFRCYKQKTILRRIERRMGLHGLSTLHQYNALLRQNPDEVGALRTDLLINVTSFFRDPEAFDELRHEAIAPRMAALPEDAPFRAWVAGCSTGEEAYSVAMLLMDENTATHRHGGVQVYATDIDEAALQAARQGVYPESIASDLVPERLSRFFERVEGGFRVVRRLRDAVVFAHQNLVADPPFSKMDLICCRNLLIYLKAETQAKLIPLFNFALKPDGILFLGKSEGVDSRDDLFEVVSKPARIFRRLPTSQPITPDTPIVPGGWRSSPAAPDTVTKHPVAPAGYADAIRQALLRHFAAAVVLVEPKGRILQFHGETGNYLDMPATEPDLNLLEMAKEGLALKLRSAIRMALEEHRTVVLDEVPFTSASDAPCVRLTVSPLAGKEGTKPLLAVIFEDVPRAPAPAASDRTADREDTPTLRHLEDELKSAQRDHRSTIAELQSANEELRVSNEEVVSTNEELQSTNEELETSKEELQSANEELATVNSQLQEKVEHLDTAYDDMANLLRSTKIATLFLDRDLRIKFFTPATNRVLKLIESDKGRPLGDLSISFVDYDLSADAKAVVNGAADVEREARDADGANYIVRIMPYRGTKERVDGVVVTFDDITKHKRIERQLQQRTKELETANTELKQHNDAMVGRELRMIELKKEVNALASQAGRPAPYDLEFAK